MKLRYVISAVFFVWAVIALDCGQVVVDSQKNISDEPFINDSPNLIAPNIPTGLKNTGATPASISLVWDAPSMLSKVEITSYEIQIDDIKPLINVGAPSTSTVIMELLSATAYQLKVRACAEICSEFSPPITAMTLTAPDVQAPSVPAGFSSNGKTTTSVSLIWNASTDNVGVTRYEVRRNNNNSLITTINAPTTNVMISGLAANTAYVFDIQACDASGNCSGFSTDVNVTTMMVPDTTTPSVPANLATSTITQTTAILGWSASTDNVGVTGYEISIDNGAAISVTTTTYNASGFTAGTTHNFKVLAKDAAGNKSAYSSPKSFTTITAPDTTAPSVPAGLMASNLMQTSATLSWTASTDNVGVTGYEISIDNGVAVSTTTNSYAASGFTAGSTHSFKVLATDAAGNKSAYSSNSSFTTTAAPPTSPDNLGLGQIGPSPIGGHTAQPTNPYSKTDYFIAPNGNDSNSGTSTSAPFRSLSKLGSIALVAGDRVFFQRGGTYRGTASIYNKDGTSTMPILISAYGTGADPIISGAEAITTTWTNYSGNIYSADIPSTVLDYIYSNSVASGTYVPYSTKVPFVFYNGVAQTLARYPNVNTSNPNASWLYKDIYNVAHSKESEGWFYLRDSNLPAIPGGGSWVGADVVTRITNWSFITGYVEENSSGSLTMNVKKFNDNQTTPTGDWKTMANWGYFLQDKLGILDQAGEWYYDRATRKLYFWKPGGGAPASSSVEYSAYDTGIEIGSTSNYFIIENLDFRYYRKTSIKINPTSTGITVRMNKFSNGMKGIIVGADDIGFILERNKFENLWQMAIDATASKGIKVTNNWLENICMVPGAVRSVWAYIAATLGSSSATSPPYLVKDNYMNNVGYIGWSGSGSGTIERNLVEHAGMILNDGSNITYDFVPYNGLLTVKNNMLLDSQGDLTSVSPSMGANYEPKWKGTYTGDKAANNIVVDGNTISNMSKAGIWVDHTLTFNASGQVVPSMGQIQRNNKIFNNPLGIGKSDFSIYHHFNFSTGQILTSNCDPRSNSSCFVSGFGDQTYGNEIYSTTSTQANLYELKVYSNGTTQLTDFGSYNNNKYFHPTNPQNNYRFENSSGNGVASVNWTLTQWQQNSGEDVGTISSNPSVPNLAPAANRGRLIKNKSWNIVTLSTSDGTLESCLYKLDGTAVGNSVQLGPLESFIAQKGCNGTN